MINTLKSTWQQGNSALGLWLSSDGMSTAEVVADLDYDYVNIDLQHGLLDYEGALRVMRALSGTEATVLCRPPWNEPGIIGKLLDAGAQGLIIPMVNTADQARQAVASCRYAPEGSRSYGPARAKRLHGDDYRDTANAGVACIPMIETVEAIEHLDEILDVSGIDAVYVGPSDLSISMGLPVANHHDDANFCGALAAVVEGCRSRGIAAGIHCQPDLVAQRLGEGFSMVTVTTDLAALAAGATTALHQARA